MACLPPPRDQQLECTASTRNVEYIEEQVEAHRHAQRSLLVDLVPDLQYSVVGTPAMTMTNGLALGIDGVGTVAAMHVPQPVCTQSIRKSCSD